MVNNNNLHQQANEIKNDRTTSFETKEILIDTLKKDMNYQKDEQIKEEKRFKHKEKQDILAKLTTDGVDLQFVDRVRKSLYPGYDPSHKQYDIWLEKISEWAREEIKTMMQLQYDKMHPSNKPYTGDLERLQSWKGLKYREEAGTKIIDVPWFGELCSTVKSGTEYRDMDKDSKRSIDNLKHSDKFKAFASTIKNCEMMELSDTYKLMNLVAKQLGTTDTIDENYINTVFKKHKNKNLPLEHPFGRVLRALYMMTGEWFVIPISVDGKTVRSVDCLYDSVWVYGNFFGFNDVRPFAKIGGSAWS